MTLGASEFDVALPLGALDDLKAQGVDVIELVGDARRTRDLKVVRALIDVAGAWGADPDRGRPKADSGALTFAGVYADEKHGGLTAALAMAQRILMLPFDRLEDDDQNPPPAVENA